MYMELRWLVPDHTTTKQPRLQYRTCLTQPHWGAWEDVPTVVDSSKPLPPTHEPKSEPEPEPTMKCVGSFEWSSDYQCSRCGVIFNIAAEDECGSPKNYGHVCSPVATS